MNLVIEKLNAWLKETNQELEKDNKNIELHELASQIDLAMQRIQFCEEYGIYPKSIIYKLPEQSCRSASSEYRVVEDVETENRESWVEVHINNKPLRLNEGDLVIKP
jgi:hypothetical protein